MFKSGGRGYGTCSFFHENLEAVYYPDNCMPKKFLKRIPRNKSKNLRKKYKKEAIELIKYFNENQSHSWLPT